MALYNSLNITYIIWIFVSMVYFRISSIFLKNNEFLNCRRIDGDRFFPKSYVANFDCIPHSMFLDKWKIRNRCQYYLNTIGAIFNGSYIMNYYHRWSLSLSIMHVMCLLNNYRHIMHSGNIFFNLISKIF